MYTKEFESRLVDIIAQGVAKGLAAHAHYSDPAPTPDAPTEVVEDDDFEENQMNLAEKEAQEDADKKAKKSAAAKKAAATKKANKLAAAAAQAAEDEAAQEAAGDPEPEEGEDEDFDDFGEEAEIMEAPKMDLKEFMDTLKREAGKHPNGELEGRKLASATLKKTYPDVEKFKVLPEEDFEPMLQAFINAIKAV